MTWVNCEKEEMEVKVEEEEEQERESRPIKWAHLCAYLCQRLAKR